MFSKGKSRKKEFIFEIFRFNSVVKIKQNIINSRKIERIKRNVCVEMEYEGRAATRNVFAVSNETKQNIHFELA